MGKIAEGGAVMLGVGPIAPHNTATVDEAWDGPAEEAKIPNDAGRSVLRRMYAWVDSDGDPDTKEAYRLPHHKVTDGSPGPANLRGVRNALSRLPQSNVPESEHEGVRRHLNRHLERDRSSSRALSAELHQLAGTTWAVRLETLRAIENVATREAFDALEPVTKQAQRTQTISTTGGVAVLPLRGLITAQPSFISLLFGGGGGLKSFRRSFREALGSDEVGSILIDVDSPGGSTDLIAETAGEIRAARGEKPIVAIADTKAASAAYWLASQADEVVVTPSGMAGSIGIFALHIDVSGADEQAGISRTLISAGRYKVEGNPFAPLDADAAEAAQAIVDDYYDFFVADVGAGRGVAEDAVRDGMGEGRMVTAKRAVGLGMADRIASYEDTVARLAGRPGGDHPSTSSKQTEHVARRRELLLAGRQHAERHAQKEGT